MIPVAGMKYQLVHHGEILTCNYMGKLNFIPARRDSFPLGICLDLYRFSFNISL